MYPSFRRTSSWLILGLLSTTIISSAGYTTPAHEMLTYTTAQNGVVLQKDTTDVAPHETPTNSAQATTYISLSIVSGDIVNELVHQDTIELFEELKTPSVIESYIIDPEDQAYSDEFESELTNLLNNW